MKNEKEELIYKTSKDYDTVLEKFFRPDIYANKENGTLTKAFAISNEQLPEIFEPLNLSGKKIATVGASGDQSLNAILQGCKDVTIIDGNSYTKPYMEYKMALIKTADFKTFKNLFITPEMFSWKTYAKISHQLSQDSKQFWDTIMLDQAETPEEGEITPHIVLKRMFRIYNKEKHSKFYKDEQTYKKLQSLLNNNDIKFEYLDAELKEFPTILKDKYDLIYLSNIYFYYQENSAEFKQIVNSLYNNQLKGGGKLVINYEFNKEASTTPKTFDKYSLEVQEVTRTVDDKAIKDTVWIINKPKIKENQEEICK